MESFDLVVSEHQKIVVQVKRFEHKEYIDLRKCFRGPNQGDYFYSRTKGICIEKKNLKALIPVFIEMCDYKVKD